MGLSVPKVRLPELQRNQPLPSNPSSRLQLGWISNPTGVLAEAQGLRPDFSCRTGICHTCMTKLIEGQVEYVTEPLDLPDPGCVLICCSHPKTDVVIEV